MSKAAGAGERERDPDEAHAQAAERRERRADRPHLGRPANDPVTRLRAQSLFGQITVFHIAQRSALQLLEWEAFEGERAELLIDTIAEQTRVLLQQWHVQRDALAAESEAGSKREPGAPAKRTAKAGRRRPPRRPAARSKPAAR